MNAKQSNTEKKNPGYLLVSLRSYDHNRRKRLAECFQLILINKCMHAFATQQSSTVVATFVSIGTYTNESMRHPKMPRKRFYSHSMHLKQKTGTVVSVSMFTTV